MGKSRIRVSIVTPVYNGEKTLARTIESVLNQSYRPSEYLIIDGLSTDRSVEIAKSYEKAFEERRIKYAIVSEKDKGMYDALNKGIRIASGELIGSINSDDWYELNAVKVMALKYAKEQYDIAWSDIYIHNKNHLIRKKAAIGKIWTTNHFCHPSMFARRSILLKYPYDPRFLDADYDMVLRANNGSAKISVARIPIANYSLGGISTRKSLKDLKKRVLMKYSTYRRNGYSRLYWMYCVGIEGLKFFMA
ncbi:MAG: glycosyltransferase [Lachnospiraceae bacterium]|nr:glycosyltransferase [Lachnospiraceae bacterium]